jgi:N-acetylmuramoyl-L-alanine amidase
LPELIEGWRLGVATVRMEADGEPYDGKVAVAEVILNRTRLQYASNGTVADTVLRKLQFSCWNTVHMRRAATCCADLTDPLTIEAMRAWRDAGDGKKRVLPPDVVLYHAAHVNPEWAEKAKFVTQIGNHLFYRERS